MSQEVPEWKYTEELKHKRDVSPVRKSSKSISQEPTDAAQGVGFVPHYLVKLTIYKSEDGTKLRCKKQYFGKEMWARNEISLIRKKYGFVGKWPSVDDESVEQYKCPVTKQHYDVNIRLEKSEILM